MLSYIVNQTEREREKRLSMATWPIKCYWNIQAAVHTLVRSPVHRNVFDVRLNNLIDNLIIQRGNNA